MKDSQKILAVFAHADDETLLAGALIAKLVADGHEVRVLCLAPGDFDRTQRLRKACDVLGVASVETLRFAEGVMWPDEVEKSDSNDIGEKLAPMLTAVPIGDLAGRIGGRISEFRPDVVITHSSYGDYGHADHAVAHRATVRAVELSGEVGVRLYALDWPKWLVRFNVRMMKLGGRDIRHMGADGRFNLSLAIETSVKSTVSIRVGSTLGVRRLASEWYADEISKGPLPMRMLERLPLLVQRIFLGTARLVLLRTPDDFSLDGEL